MDPNSTHVNPNPVDTGILDIVEVAVHDKIGTLLQSAPLFNKEDQATSICRVISLSEQIDDQRERLTNVIGKGIKNLLLAHTGNVVIPPSHSLLCLQVLLKDRKEKVEGEYRDLAESTVPHAKNPTYQLSVEDATGLLLDYDDCWIHSLSMVLIDLNGWKDKISNCNDLASKANNEQSNHTEVTLFVLADYVIDDKVIGSREKLKEFLEELGQKVQIQKVHVTCSSVDYGKEEYSHVIV